MGYDTHIKLSTGWCPTAYTIKIAEMALSDNLMPRREMDARVSLTPGYIPGRQPAPYTENIRTRVAYLKSGMIIFFSFSFSFAVSESIVLPLHSREEWIINHAVKFSSHLTSLKNKTNLYPKWNMFSVIFNVRAFEFLSVKGVYFKRGVEEDLKTFWWVFYEKSTCPSSFMSWKNLERETKPGAFSRWGSFCFFIR